jgi:hypothetical protein
VPLYFAYGLNMDVAAMAIRCPHSRAIGPARLLRHRLAVMREGWLTPVRDLHGCVHGVLWGLAFSDIPALDRFEQVGEGLYRKLSQPVATSSAAKRALVYFGANSGPGTPRPDALAATIAAARAHGLPSEAVRALTRLGPSGENDDVAPSERRAVRPLFATPFDRS